VEKEDVYIIRERVLDACTLIHFSDRLFAANPETPPGRIAFELLRVWMDRVYTPGTRYMEGYKGDLDRDRAQRFVEAFDDDEYSYIERFHRFIEIRLDRLGEKDRKEEIFPQNDTWSGIVRDAGNILGLFGEDAEKRAERFRDARNKLS